LKDFELKIGYISVPLGLLFKGYGQLHLNDKISIEASPIDDCQALYEGRREADQRIVFITPLRFMVSRAA
jgi:hypothetical protein